MNWRCDVFALTLLLSTTIGLALGALGGGGSMLTVPILTYVGGMAPKTAIASSLVVVAATSTVGAIARARSGHVRGRIALSFGAAGMVGAYAGGRLAGLISSQASLVVFALTMIATAGAMLRPKARPVRTGELAVGKALAAGASVGVVTGLIGTGGGFLIVPALVLFAGLPIDAAVGTSLVVIAMQSIAGIVGRLGHVDIDIAITAAVTVFATSGTLLGSWIGRRVSPARLQRAFSVLVIATATTMLVGELVA